MNAFAFGIQIRPLKVNADNAGDILRNCIFNRRNCGQHFFTGIGNQGWQHGGCAKLPMTGHNRANAINSGGMIEQDTPAAIHLNIDKARGKNVAFGVIYNRI